MSISPSINLSFNSSASSVKGPLEAVHGAHQVAEKFITRPRPLKSFNDSFLPSPDKNGVIGMEAFFSNFIKFKFSKTQKIENSNFQKLEFSNFQEFENV